MGPGDGGSSEASRAVGSIVKLDGTQEAQVLAVTCSAPPGRPEALDSQVVGGQADSSGQRRQHQSGVCPYHAQKNALKPWAA